MAAVRVEGIRKSYGAVAAVRGVTFSVEEGEVVAILGPNGAGKTTTVEILEGFRHRDAGQVEVLGTDPADGGPEWRNRVGVVLQQCGINPYLSVAEALQMHAEYYRKPRAVAEVIELVGLGGKAASRVKTLSGGQQRRLDLGLGLIGDPELLFLDEPTTGFDPGARRQAWEVVRQLCAGGKTVVLTTHYIEEAQALADRVIVISAGQIVAEGTPESIGGRAQAAARIRFRLPDGWSMDALPAEVPVVAEPNGELTVETAEPLPMLHRLSGWALDHDVDLLGLTVTRPSLEDVYLALTDEAEAEAGPRSDR